MPVYIQLEDERPVIDTAKCKLQYEETAIDMTGRTLSLYDMEWNVVDGTLGAGVACKVLELRDPFTGMTFQVPMPLDVSKQIGSKLAGKKRKVLNRHG